jgi:hypothetical protein
MLKILKHIQTTISCRFTDFMVYEVDKGNKVVRLKNIEKPADDKGETDILEKHVPVSSSNASGAKQPSLKARWSTEIASTLASTLSSRVLKELETLVIQGPNYPPETEGAERTEISIDGNGNGLEPKPCQSEEKEDCELVLAENFRSYIWLGSPSVAKPNELVKQADFKKRKGRGKSCKRQNEKVDERLVLSDVCYAI